MINRMHLVFQVFTRGLQTALPAHASAGGSGALHGGRQPQSKLVCLLQRQPLSAYFCARGQNQQGHARLSVQSKMRERILRWAAKPLPPIKTLVQTQHATAHLLVCSRARQRRAVASLREPSGTTCTSPRRSSRTPAALPPHAFPRGCHAAVSRNCPATLARACSSLPQCWLHIFCYVAMRLTTQNSGFS